MKVRFGETPKTTRVRYSEHYFWGAQATSLLAAAACRGSSAYIIRNNENDCFRQAAGKLRAGSPRSPDRRIRGTRSMTLYATHA